MTTWPARPARRTCSTRTSRHSAGSSALLRATLNGIDRLGRLAAAVSVVLVVGIAALVLAEIFSRTVLNVSLSFSWEYSAYALGMAIFCGAAFTLRSGGHVRVTFMTSAFPRAARAIELLATTLGLAMSSYVALALSQFAWRSFERGSTSPTIDATPLAIPQSALAVGAILLALAFVARLIRLIINEPADDEQLMNAFNVE